MTTDADGPRVAGRHVSPHIIEALDDLSTSCAQLISLIDSTDILLEQVDAPARAALEALVLAMRERAGAAARRARYLWAVEVRQAAWEVCHDD